MAKLALLCPHCQCRGFIEEANLKGGPVNIKCPKCKQSFVHHQQGRIAYRRTPLPNVRYGPFGFDFSSLPNDGQILDISQTGMKIQVFRQIPSTKERYNFKFRLPPRNEEVKVKGETIWVKRETDSLSKVGIKFINMDVHSQKLIGFFLMP